MSPMENETNFKASNHVEHFQSILKMYNKHTREDIGATTANVAGISKVVEFIIG